MASAVLSKTPYPSVGWKASPGSPGVASVSVHGLWPGTEHQSPPLQGSSDPGKGHPAHASKHVHVQVAGTGSARTGSHWAFHGDGSGLEARVMSARAPPAYLPRIMSSSHHHVTELALHATSEGPPGPRGRYACHTLPYGRDDGSNPSRAQAGGGVA